MNEKTLSITELKAYLKDVLEKQGIHTKETHSYLKTDYNNLVYSCPYCNNFKSDKWPTNDPNIHNDSIKGFVDPCNQDYNKIFTRNNKGEIIPLTQVASYMYDELCLGLERHSIIWQIEKLLSLKQELNELAGKNTKFKNIIQKYEILINKEISDIIMLFRSLELS